MEAEIFDRFKSSSASLQRLRLLHQQPPQAAAARGQPAPRDLHHPLCPLGQVRAEHSRRKKKLPMLALQVCGTRKVGADESRQDHQAFANGADSPDSKEV